MGKKQRYQRFEVLTSLICIREMQFQLHRLKRISSNCDTEVQIIRSKFKSVCYHLSFIDNVIRKFKEWNGDYQNKVTDENYISLKLMNVSFY